MSTIFSEVAGCTWAHGKRIKSIVLHDEKLDLVFTDATSLCIEDTGQNCYESRYMRTDDESSFFVGSQFWRAIVKNASDVPGEDGCEHEVQFLDVCTSHGVFTLSCHNEHDGCYGGFAVSGARREVK